MRNKALHTRPQIETGMTAANAIGHTLVKAKHRSAHMQKILLSVSLGLSGILVMLPAIAATPQSMELDSRFRAVEAWMDIHMISELGPSATAALVDNQDIVWRYAYGFANIEEKIPATPETTYSICSISKLFTSIAIMTLVEEGKVDLDGELGDYLDDFQLETAEDTVEEPVTIRGLLSHSAGLPREGIGAYWNAADFPAESELEARVNPLGLLYTPFTNYQYSNIGMSLLGKVVSEVSDKDYKTYVQTEILDPLKLDTMSSDLPLDGDGGRFSTGYTDHDASGHRDPIAPYMLDGFAPAAGFAASVIDLSRFAAWQFRLLETGEEEILSRKTLRNMHRVHWMDPGDPESGINGLGFYHMTIGTTPVIGHGGYCLGHRAEFVMDNASQIAVTTMVNANDISPSLLAAAVYELTADALKATRDEESTSDSDVLATLKDMQQFEGVYRWPGAPDGVYLIPKADGELEQIQLFSDQPAQTARSYRRIGGDLFRRVRKDGDLGEDLLFERDESGEIVSILSEGYRYTRPHP